MYVHVKFRGIVVKKRINKHLTKEKWNDGKVKMTTCQYKQAPNCRHWYNIFPDCFKQFSVFIYLYFNFSIEIFIHIETSEWDNVIGDIFRFVSLSHHIQKFTWSILQWNACIFHAIDAYTIHSNIIQYNFSSFFIFVSCICSRSINIYMFMFHVNVYLFFLLAWKKLFVAWKVLKTVILWFFLSSAMQKRNSSISKWNKMYNNIMLL